jgi:hypothetical protein
MGSRRLPSSLATHLHRCALFRSGQCCSTCPQAGKDACTIKDIEDVPAHLLARASKDLATPLGAVALQRHGNVGLGANVHVARNMPHCAMHSAAAARPVDACDKAIGDSTLRYVQVQHSAREDHVKKEEVVQVADVVPLARQKSVSLSSRLGRSMFKESLAVNSMQPYFNLSEQMVFQPTVEMRPVTCLAVVLNALKHDPYKTWKPIWRWNSEEVLLSNETGFVSLSADKIKANPGIQLHEMAELARNNGARAQAYPACPSMRSEEAFRSRVKSVCSSTSEVEEHVIVYMLSSSGQWKFAPVAGYHAISDSVLILDLDRTKAPRWIGVKRLWGSMCALSEGKMGGFVAVGSMMSERATSASPVTACCPRVVRSWSESKLVVSPAFEMRAMSANAEPCPLGVWAAAHVTAQRVEGVPSRRSQRMSRHATTRAGNAYAVKARSRASNNNKVKDASPTLSTEEVFANVVGGLLLQSFQQSRASVPGCGRYVHSMRADSNPAERLPASAEGPP